MTISYFLSPYCHAKLIYAVLLYYFNTCNIGVYIFRSSKVSLQIQLKLQLGKHIRSDRITQTSGPWNNTDTILNHGIGQTDF